VSFENPQVIAALQFSTCRSTCCYYVHLKNVKTKRIFLLHIIKMLT